MLNRLKNGISFSFEMAVYATFLFISGLTLPIFLIFIIKFTGYSEIVEEIAKALVIFFLILKLPNFKIKILAGVFFGFLFGISENFLYLNQIFQSGDLDVFWQRFLWTVPMHVMTILIMIFATLIKKWFLIFGLVAAVVLHLLFNSLAVEFLAW